MAKFASSLLTLVVLVAFFALAGCGGSSSSSLGNFVGTWQGNHQFRTSGGQVEDIGTIQFTVSQGGAISGTMTKTSTGESVPVTGSLRTGGDILLTYRFAGFSADRNAEGIVRFNNNNQLEAFTDGDPGLPTRGGTAGTVLGRLQFVVVRLNQ